MIKNLKDLVIILLTGGVLTLLGIIIIGDYYVALMENRPVDESVITLMKMSLTGMIGVIAGYIGSKEVARVYVIIFSVAIIGTLGYGGYYIYNDIMTRMATLRSNNAKMEVAIQSKDAAINEIQNNLKKQIELTRNLQSGLQRIELENTRIKDQIDEINILENSIKDTIQTEKTINEEIDFVFDAITNSTTGK